MIVEKEPEWGSHFLENLSRDLKKDFPDIQGFSVTNLKYCRLLYKYIPIGPHIGDENKLTLITDIYQHIIKIPWGHIKLLINKIKDHKEALFYIHETMENGWSRDVLALQIKSKLFKRQGKAITNFKDTLPDPQSDLAQQTLKDPYTFDFLTLTNPYNERNIENQLIR